MYSVIKNYSEYTLILPLYINLNTLWYDMIYDMIWYIWLLQLGWHPVAAVQHTFTHKQYIEQHNWHKQYVEQNN